MAQAEATLNKWSFFSSASKFDDASELYSRAANNFKIAKNWDMASQCFVKCAEMSLKSDSQYEAATNYVLAAEMSQRVDPGVSIGLYREAIRLLSEQGRFSTAAKHTETIADMYDKDNNIKEAVHYYEQAAEYYAGENSFARAGKALEKVGLLSASLEDYERALNVFEKLGTDSLENNLLKFNAKKHFLHAGFCALARNDTVKANNAINRFAELDFNFRESAECKLLENLTAACEDMDKDKFADVLYSYDQVRRLEPWETSILVKIKGLIESSTTTGELDDLR